LMFSALEGHEMGEIFVRRHREVFFNSVTDYIERRVRARAFRKVDAMLAARAFTGMVSHIGIFSVLLPGMAPKMDRQDLIHGMVKVFLEGVTRRKRAPSKKLQR
ncbi:MAG: TetR/AcrR family transcriptional regulator C-terminal domain-containing protein, partial [Bryobacterales bacterium]|nr:TetR/AcrR family transcriptional regulator C-terminal domain-containing protein [Bryobacterales bacterium]